MKKYFVLSGLALRDNNRGTAALGYGAFSFLYNRGIMNDDHEVLVMHFTKRPWHWKDKREVVNIQGKQWIVNTVYFSSLERFLYFKGILPRFTKLWKYSSNIEFVASINGGDGFSDIYNTFTFKQRLGESLFAMKSGIRLIQLPQTMGPFEKPENYEIAKKILLYSDLVFVRDTKFVQELTKMGINYELTNDLSAYMEPEPWDIDIIPDSIGLNVSGLCYSNSFRTLSGQFESYPDLIDGIISNFQKKGKTIYLIPHSYNYNEPEESNDDIIACRNAYDRLKDKSNVYFIDKDLISPQIKYVISKMSFFIGARMHANFAAIYTNVPVFGTAYSYKFEGAFDANGLNGKEQTAMINNISVSDIPLIIDKIDKFYNKVIDKN